MQHNRSHKVHVLWIAPERGAAAELGTKLTREGASVTRLGSARAALELLDSPDLTIPHCVLVDPAVAGLHALLLAIRAHPGLSHIPVVYVSASIDQTALDEAQAVGADDVYWTADEGYLATLVQALEDMHPEERPALNGNVAFILDSRHERRRLLGRVYRNAGFQVVFGTCEQDLLRYAYDESPMHVVVASRALLGGGSEEVHRLRTLMGKQSLPWVLLDEGERDPRLGGVQGTDRIAAMGEDGPTENVLFLTNELLASDRASARGSRRLLFNGLCAFRTPETFAYRFASLYNISRTGLYVRTLVPLEKGRTVHLELTPPDADCLHLSGVVAWSRGVGRGGQLAPPGFGVQLLASQCAPTDLDAYVQAYEVLAADHRRCVHRPSGTRQRAMARLSMAPDAQSA